MSSYIGIDISKKQLDVDPRCLGKVSSFPNDKQGIMKLISNLNSMQTNDISPCVVVEATGGYENKIVANCRDNNIDIHVAHPNKVRSFAKAKGILAKTDNLDAKLLSDYGELMKVSPDPALLCNDALKIKVLLTRREQLMNDRQRDRNRIDKIEDQDIITSITDHILWIDKEIKSIEKLISESSKADGVKTKIDLLTSIPSVGNLVASYLVAHLPELGTLNHKSIAALVGVAPFNRDSGNFSGKRFIQGGRRSLRRILYMSAISSTRYNPDLKIFYNRLKSNGKPSKVALIAVARKILTTTNCVISRQSPWQDKTQN